jgi:hypothetical protein
MQNDIKVGDIRDAIGKNYVTVVLGRGGPRSNPYAIERFSRAHFVVTSGANIPEGVATETIL